jgi:hypothetical protein
VGRAWKAETVQARAEEEREAMETPIKAQAAGCTKDGQQKMQT